MKKSKTHLEIKITQAWWGVPLTLVVQRQRWVDGSL